MRGASGRRTAVPGMARRCGMCWRGPNDFSTRQGWPHDRIDVYPLGDGDKPCAGNIFLRR